MNGNHLRDALSDRGFKFDKDLDAWQGPNGCKIADQFILDCDDYHTCDVQTKILAAVDEGATHVCAIVASTRPYQINVYYKV